jgi:hypothetical protein
MNEGIFVSLPCTVKELEKAEKVWFRMPSAAADLPEVNALLSCALSSKH